MKSINKTIESNDIGKLFSMHGNPSPKYKGIFVCNDFYRAADSYYYFKFYTKLGRPPEKFIYIPINDIYTFVVIDEAVTSVQEYNKHSRPVTFIKILSGENIGWAPKQMFRHFNIHELK